MFYDDLALLNETFNLTDDPNFKNNTPNQDVPHEEIQIESNEDVTYKIPLNKYFVKRGFCLLTSKVPAS
jgi:hypothetical protein